jgi:hypothetical protein
MGPNGNVLGVKTAVQIPQGYQNVDIQWNSSKQIFEMLGESMEIANNRIDYLTSADGIHWTLQKGPPPVTASGSMTMCSASISDRQFLLTAVQFFDGANGSAAESQAQACNTNLKMNLTALKSEGWPCASTATTIQYVRTCVQLVNQQLGNGQVSSGTVGTPAATPATGAAGADSHVRTPTFDPQNDGVVIYAQTTDTINSMGNQIYSTTWRPDTSMVQVAAVSSNSCVASSSDQTYLLTAVQFFNTAANTSGANQAAECNAKLKANITALQSEGWPCASTNTTIQYIKTCVSLVSQLAAGH